MSVLPPLLNDGNMVAQTGLGNFPIDDNGVYSKSRSDVFHRSLHQDPLRVVSAQGQYLQLSNGQQVFDATGGAAVSSLGHGNEQYVVASITAWDVSC